MVRAFGYRTNGGPDVQEFLDLDMPSPLPGELLVEVRAAGVNPADWKVRSGMASELGSELPAVLGFEVAGVVREVGQDADGFTVGDEIFGQAAPGSGGYAEHTLVTAAQAAKKPPQLSFTDAAALTVAAATAYDGVTQLGLTDGQTLLINGVSGGVGVAAAQIARDFGINVIGVANEDKRAFVETLGVTLVPYGDGVADRVRELMPDGVDAIFDLAGGASIAAVADLLADRTKLISAGDPETVARLGGHFMERGGDPDVLEKVAAMAADGKLDPLVEDIRPFDEAGEALAAVETGHARGKVVIQVS